MSSVRSPGRSILAAALAVVFAGLAATPAQARQIGKDGALTVGAANTTVNTTTALTAAAAAGATTITVASAAGITAGDVLMVYQAQGATIGTANTSAYGAVTALNSAGRYEFVSVASVAGTTITLGTLCDTTPLRFSYANGAQVVRVPQYSSLTVNAGASIVPAAWNGSTGGVVAVIVDGTATINGSINANALGFRGGAIDNATTAAGTDVTAFLATTTADGAEKGESIAGSQATYDGLGGRYNRGAPANGGGGGNAHNAGGGGGANGGSAVGWNGQGVPDTSVAGWVTAWNLDGTLTATTNSPGGGRGGYTYGASDQNALTVAPGTASWGGNSRRQRGGLGGRPLANNPSIVGDTRLFFGGGGGAGDGNNGAASAGARGGGLVFVVANAVAGSGALQANGGTATNTVPGHNDAPGGGGGGGSVVLVAPSAGGLNLSAIGGNGGNQLITNNESEGPGGGGGGGFIASPIGAGTVTGGANGTTSSAAVTEFLPNGATRGNTGNTATAPTLSNLPLCNFAGSADLRLTKTNTPGVNGEVDQAADTVVSGATTTYTLVVTNSGPNSVTGAVVVDTPAAGLTCPPANAVTCTSPAAGACPVGPLTVANLTAGVTLGTLPATVGSNTATFTFSCTVQ
ncbi:MAG: hypothetical protein ACOY82_02725 [Pseudomonadota bacterium]